MVKRQVEAREAHGRRSRAPVRWGKLLFLLFCAFFLLIVLFLISGV